MRKLVCFTVGFACICGICTYGMNLPWILPAAAGALLFGVAAVALCGKRGCLAPAITVLTGCLAGLVWCGAFTLIYLRPVTVLDGQELSMTVTITDYSRVTQYGATAEGRVMLEGKPYQAWVSLNEQMELGPADAVEGIFRIRMTTPGGLRESRAMQGSGVFLVLNQRDALTVFPAEEIPARYYPAVFAGRIRQILETVFPEDCRSFAKALLMGDTSDLEHGTDAALKVSGIRHIAAVSGLHISILYSLICFLTLRSRILTAAAGIPVLFLFAAMTGFSPSAVRACIMCGLMMTAAAFEREYDPPTALAFAVLVMLAVNPMAVTSVSLQMSTACVSGIMLFHDTISRWLKTRFVRGKGLMSGFTALVCGSISVTLSSMSLVTPLCAFCFGTVSLLSPVSNLLTLWMVSFVFVGLVLVCAVYLLMPGAAVILASVLAWPIRYVLITAKAMAAFPLTAVYTRSIYIVFWLVFVYVLLVIFLRMHKKRPGVLLCCGVLGLSLALLASWAEPLTADTCITMLDVGQGQAILLQSEGKTFLVDCGGDRDAETGETVAQTLLSQGIRRLDGIVLTHHDRDHAGGIPALLASVDTELLFLPDTRSDFAVPEFGGKTVYVWEDLELTFGDARLQIFGPVYSGADNENSLCVLFDTENCDILITGDRSAFGERMLLRNRMLPDVDILVAGHHGAAEATSEELLQAVTPEMILISAARYNIYGHPSQEMLQRAARFGCTVYRTDENGTITIRR